MQEQLVLSIQKQLRELTTKNFSKVYVEKYIYPICKYIAFSKQKKFLIAGSQGIGKSTLLKILNKHLTIFYKKRTLSLSLDDYYLTKKERIVLSNKFHPLLLTRGVPGTHDTKLLLQNIMSFERSQYPFQLPIFNKLNDDRSKKFKLINSKKDILLVEGWCCGCPPVNKSYLLKNINSLEKKWDYNNNWRKFYNQKLKNEYAKIFNHFNSIIYIKPPTFSYISKWRFRQEKMMKAKSYNKQSMNKKQVTEFIQYYEKITKWMIKKMPSISNLTIYVDGNQKIKKIKWKH